MQVQKQPKDADAKSKCEAFSSFFNFELVFQNIVTGKLYC